MEETVHSDEGIVAVLCSSVGASIWDIGEDTLGLVSCVEIIFLGTILTTVLLFLGRIVPGLLGTPFGTRISFSSSSGLLRTTELVPG